MSRVSQQQPTDPRGSSRQAMLWTEGVSKRYGANDAVRDLNLDIAAGAIVGVIGPSGSGKTTAVRLLLGATTPTSGQVRVFGKPPETFDAADRSRIGYMPQQVALYPHLSIHENLNFMASIYGVPLRRRKRLNEALAFVELTQDRRKLLRDASGGMQRRVSLAATLLHNPELLFLDEPTAGIDPVLRRKFWDYFSDLRDDGRTLMVTTQYVGEAAYCDLVAVLAQGQLLALETPRGLRRRAYGGDFVDVVGEVDLEDELVRALRGLPFVTDAERLDGDRRQVRILVTDADEDLPRLRRWFGEQHVALSSLQQYQPSYDDMFVQLVQQQGG